MTSSNFAELGDAIADEAFPEVDLALRRGRHIDREDNAWYTFLIDAQAHLEAFYRRYGCELVHRSDGFFYLLPTNDRLGKRHLSLHEMLVGQALTLLYLDASTVEQGGIATRDQLLGTLASVMGTDSLVRTLNPKKKRYDERVAQETVRSKVADAVRRLSTLGFVDLLDADRFRLRSALMRFAEPVRGHGAPSEALERLVAQGEAILADPALDIENFDERDDEDDDAIEDQDDAVDEAAEAAKDSAYEELAQELGAGLFEEPEPPPPPDLDTPDEEIMADFLADSEEQPEDEQAPEHNDRAESEPPPEDEA